MIDIFLQKIMPILIFFLIGYSLKLKKIFTKEDGGTLLKVIFYILLPSLSILSIGQTKINKELIIYPLIAIIMHSIMFVVGKIIIKFIKLSENEQKILRGGIMIMNMSFILPFFIMFYGEKEVYRYALFDSGNVIVVSSVIYYIFMTKEHQSFVNKMKIIMKSPLIISLILGMIINILKIKFPISIEITLKEIVKISGPIIMIALGTYFSPNFKKFKLAISIVAIKMISIFCIGLLIGRIFNVDKVIKDILLLAALAPLGNNLLTYTYVSDGDMDLASTTVSISIIISFILISIFLVVFR